MDNGKKYYGISMDVLTESLASWYDFLQECLDILCTQCNPST